MKLFLIPFALACLFCISWGVSESPQDKKTEPAASAKSTEQEKEVPVVINEGFVPVDNMHHFMEYICEPSYKGLKAVLAEEPKDRRAWKAFKNHALVLAETSAMVAARGPKEEDKSKLWKQISLDVHKHGTALYKSAGNYEQAKLHYGLMIDQCNKCHTDFAKGKHQLTK